MFHADGVPGWRRNLVVCTVGAFTTVLAMTVLLPILPAFVTQLAANRHTLLTPGAVARWSAICFGATYLASGLAAPFWGRMADRFGRKPILLRASLGMAVCMSLIGVAQSLWQLLALRLLAGLVGGFASGATVLVATQTPKARSASALGVLASGTMAGSVAGPLLGGVLGQWIGIRGTFLLAGGLIFGSFLLVVFLVREAPRRVPAAGVRSGAWKQVPDRRLVLALLCAGMLLTLANMSIEPIVTLFVAELVSRPGVVAPWSGLVMSAAALGSVIAAPPVGRLADRIGHRRVAISGMVLCAALLPPQALVRSVWVLVVLRFVMGLALAGLMPSIISLLRHAVPPAIAGRILALNVSAQFAGFVIGPLLGSAVASHVGMRPVFPATAVVMLAGAILLWRSGAPAPANA